MFGSIGYTELVFLGIIAVILFGSKLPDVARSLGSSYREFRRGLDDIKASFNEDVSDTYSSNRLPDYRDTYDDELEPTGPQFEPPSVGSDEDAMPEVDRESQSDSLKD